MKRSPLPIAIDRVEALWMVVAVTKANRRGPNNSRYLGGIDVFRKALAKVHPSLTVEQYTLRHSPARFSCTNGHSFTAVPYHLLQHKYGCRECSYKVRAAARRSKGEKAFRAIVAMEGKYEIIGKYKGSRQPIKMRCLTCEAEFEPHPNNMVNNHTGCPVCSAAEKHGSYSAHKKVEVAGKLFDLQGWEGLFLELANRDGSEDVANLISQKEAPFRLAYKIGKKKHWFYPDFKRPDGSVIEVKSFYTLLKSLAVNKAKAKSLSKAGIAVDFVVVTSLDKLVRLPRDWFTWKDGTLHAMSVKHEAKPMVILSVDPGSKNYAWSVVRIEAPAKFKLLEVGMLSNPITNLASVNFEREVAAFSDEIENLCLKHHVTHFAGERFMTRGFGGDQIELVSFMHGIVMAIMHSGRDKRKKLNHNLLLTAAEWKNSVNKNVLVLDEAYEHITPHILDSACIGAYAYYRLLGVPPFSFGKKNVTRMLTNMIDAQSHTKGRKKVRKQRAVS